MESDHGAVYRFGRFTERHRDLDTAGGESGIWRGKCASDPVLLAEIIRRHAPLAKRVVFETGPLSTWFYHALTAEGVPAICIEARHAQKILNETLNKTDANDADGLARLAEAGFDKAVRVKGFDAMLARTLIGVRKLCVSVVRFPFAQKLGK